jgi:hypothetical protein
MAIGCLPVRSRPVIVAILIVTGLTAPGAAGIDATELRASGTQAWSQLIEQAAQLRLPTRFLRFIEPTFVTVEFEDLQAFAAEYHPAEHRMILNRALSFNAAAGTLKPLSSLPHRDVGTLYHELFHAYLDYARTHRDRAVQDLGASRLLRVAEGVRACRYQTVQITPVPQRKTALETRYLTEAESWEALEETWAVFVGWAIWTHLELSGTTRNNLANNFHRWIKRLQLADRAGDLIGYYEPQEPEERAMTRKRYLAPSHRLTPDETRLLLETVLEIPPDDASKAAKAMQSRTETCSAGS